MKNIIKFIKELTKKQILIIAIVVIVVLGFIFIKNKNGQSETYTVTRTSISQEVLVTGKTKAVQNVNLGFEKSGKISVVYAKIGDKVKAGDILAETDHRDLNASLLKASASLDEERIKLDQIKRGSTSTYNDAYDGMLTSLHSAYTTADNSIRNNVDQFFDNPREYNPIFDVYVTDAQGYKHTFDVSNETVLKFLYERVEIEKILTSWDESLKSIKTGDDLSTYITSSEKNLSKIKKFVDDVSLAMNSITIYDPKYESTLTSYKNIISGARSAITSAIVDILVSKEKLNNAPKIVNSSDKNVVFDEVLAEEARVAQFEADMKNIQAQIAKTIIRSPISGIVTKQDAKVGQIVSSNETLISVVSENDLEIEANVSEVNIGKVAIGNEVNIDLDAFPDVTFKGKVSYIEPGETIIDGVVNFKVTVVFEDKLDSKIKSGLSANLLIETAMKDNVIAVPQYTVFTKNKESFVKKISQGKEEEVMIKTGLVSKDGLIEVLSGLKEGDKILLNLQ